jgi:hypothetical protein
MTLAYVVCVGRELLVAALITGSGLVALLCLYDTRRARNRNGSGHHQGSLE